MAGGARRLTARGVGFAVVAIAAWLTALAMASREILALGALAAALAVLALIHSARRSGSMTATRRFAPASPDSATAVTVRLDVRNGGRRVVEGRLVDRCRGVDAVTIPLPGTRPGRTATLEFELPPQRRGVHEMGPARLWREDPFGLVAAATEVSGVDTIVVTPAVTELPGWGPLAGPTGGTSPVPARRRDNHDDDVTTRDYRPGDALSRVHWRVSARRGQLMVRQQEAHSRPNVTIVLDTMASSYPDADSSGASERFDWAIGMTASIVAHLDRSGRRATILESGEPQLRDAAVRSGRFGLAQLLEELARLRLAESASIALDPPPGPVVAIVGDSSPAVLRAIAASRNASDVAAAFVLPADDRVADSLADAGFACVSVDVGSDPATAWLAAELQRTPARVR